MIRKPGDAPNRQQKPVLEQANPVSGKAPKKPLQDAQVNIFDHSLPAPKHKAPELYTTKRISEGPKAVQSSDSLIALDVRVKLPEITVRETQSGRHDLVAEYQSKPLPLIVPVYASPHPMALRDKNDRLIGIETHWEDLTVPATRLSPTEITDHLGNKYTLGPVFSSGAFGAVRIIKKSDRLLDQIYVAKELARAADPDSTLPAPQGVPTHGQKTVGLRSTDPEMIKAEVNVMLATGSALAPHSVLRTQDRDFLLLPLLDGTLHDLWVEAIDGHPRHVKLPEQFRNSLPHAALYEGARALVPIHGNNYVHRDVKPDNFLVEKRTGTLYLADFGLAVPRTGVATNRGGTPAYMPPEAFFPLNDQIPFLASKADVWSVGATAVQMMIDDNFLWPFARDHQNFIDAREGKPAMNEMVKLRNAYAEAWTAHYQWATVQHYRGSGIKMSQKTPMGAKFKALYEVDKKLFLPILSAMHPDPQKRASAKQLVALIEKHKGTTAPKLTDLSQYLVSRARSEAEQMLADDVQAQTAPRGRSPRSGSGSNSRSQSTPRPEGFARLSEEEIAALSTTFKKEPKA